MAREIKVHTTFSLIEKFKKDTSLTENEKMLLKYLPHKVQNIIWELNSSMMYPIPYCFAAILATISGSIGNSTTLHAHNGYKVRANIFVAIIGESGENKSHPIAWFTEPLWKYNSKLVSNYNDKVDSYEKEIAKANSDAEKPKLEQLVIQDTTIEAIKSILDDNPRGIVVIYDELISWIKSFSRYKGSKTSEEGEWISIYDGREIIVNRKGKLKILNIKHPYITLIGSIQPYVLCDAFKGIGQEDGLVWRLLMVHSEHPASPILWNDKKPDENLEKEWDNIIMSLIDSSITKDPDNPEIVRYTDDAWSVIMSWQNTTEVEYTTSRSQKELSVWRKVQVSINKIALCLKKLWIACNEDIQEIGDGDKGDLPTDDDPLGKNGFIGMQMAIAATQIMNYFCENALQTLNMMTDMFPRPLSQEQRRILKMFTTSEFVSRSTIVTRAMSKGMRERTIDRQLALMRGAYLEYQHGKYKLTEVGKMAISGEKYQPKHV